MKRTVYIFAKPTIVGLGGYLTYSKIDQADEVNWIYKEDSEIMTRVFKHSKLKGMVSKQFMTFIVL